MKAKITTLTPVHISSGNKNACFVYHNDNNLLYCYNIEDLIKFIPTNILLNLDFKDANERGKRNLINVFNKYVKYDQVKPKYYTYYNYKPFTVDISEQIKELNRPYIPGSTIKGAIMNAILYNLLLSKKDKVETFINTNNIDNKKFKTNLFDFVFVNKFDSLFKDFASCIICQDLYFDDLSLCTSDKLNMSEKDTRTTFEYYECIKENQELCTRFIYIDRNRYKRFSAKYSNNPLFNNLKSFTIENNICNACSNYYHSLINDEKNYFIKDEMKYFEKNDFEGRIDIIDFLENIKFDKNSFYLRIGKNTNYFYKTISIFFKENFNNFYEKNIFLFTSLKANKENKEHIAKVMPKARTVYEYNDKYYLPGFIKVELFNKN